MQVLFLQEVFLHCYNRSVSLEQRGPHMDLYLEYVLVYVLHMVKQIKPVLKGHLWDKEKVAS
jgi:hypothetical protein